MSTPSINGRCEVPDGKVTFALPDDQSFAIDLLDTIYELRDLADGVVKEGGSHREYLEQVRALLQTRYAVSLTMTQADWLNDQLDLLHAEKKMQRSDAIANVLKSRSSMA